MTSVLVARELARLDIDIVAFGEVRFAGQGFIMEDGTGYIPSSGLGRTQDECRLWGVGFIIKPSIARKLQNLPIGYSAPKTPNPGQQVCHYHQCVRTNSAG